MRCAPDSLTRLIRQVIESMGYELVGVELLSGKKAGALLRIYVDHESGITLDDCSAVSHQVSGVLDVEDLIEENYDLEVSSPGADRPLFDKEHYERFVGRKARIKLRTKLLGRRRYEGVLVGVKDDNIVIEVEDEQVNLPLDQIDTARLVPEF